MNADERIVEAYLLSLKMGRVVYEPDGSVPPDFAVDGRVAIEVRRLNQHYEVAGELRGLEQDSIPLRQRLENLLAEFAEENSAASWFVLFNFQRPLAAWKQLRPKIRTALRTFLESPVDAAWRIPIDGQFSLTTLRASTVHDRRFLFGGYTDMDSGGWIVSEIIRNVTAYMAEKTQKVTPHLHNYPTWWLIFVDYIGTAREAAEVRQHVSRTGPWERVLVLNPVDLIAYEI